jgi:hypothetical protein
MHNVKRLLTSDSAAAIGLASLLLGSLAAQGVTASLPLLFATVAVFSYVVLASGRLLLRVAHASDLPLVAAWPLGITATGLALLALVTVVSVTAALAFVFWAAAVIVADMATSHLQKRERTSDRADLVGFAVCCVFVAVWCKDLAQVPAILASTGKFPAWSDYFLHAGVISQFGDPYAVGRGAIWLSDTPRFLYHYASYTLAAVFAWPLDQPGLQLATSVWAPIGIFCLAGATYTLGVTLAGIAGGLAALGALFLLPDASNYGLRNGFFSFHWSLLAIPTSGYVLGAAMLAIVFLHRWVQTRAPVALAMGAALMVATALFRAHVFVLLMPAWLCMVAAASHTVRQRRLQFIVLAGALAIGVALALRFAPHMPAEISWVFDEGRALERFLHFVHRRQEPTAYQGLYQRIANEFGEGTGIAAGVLLVYPASLGVFLLLCPLAFTLLRGRLQLAGVDGFPIALLVIYAALLLVAPIPAHHDATDFTQRPFVLLYAVVAAWTAASLVRWLSEQGTHGKRLWQTLLAGTVLALPFIWTHAAEMARPKFYWSRPFIAHTVAPDLLAAADFLRSRARLGDTLAAWPLSTRDVGLDAPTELIALTAVPAYLTRVWIHEARGGTARIAAMRRYSALREVAESHDWESAAQRLRHLGLRWYIVTDAKEPRWDPQRASASWAGAAVAIYDSAR